VRQDCAGWIADLERSMPTVIVAVRTQDDRDVQGARITIDGAPEALTGRPTALDPGEHAVVVDAPGFTSTTERLFVNATEKNRLVVVKLAPEASAPRPPASTPPNTTEPARAASAHGGPPTASWILGGVGVAALGVSVVFGFSAQKQLADAEHAPCAATKSCDESIRTSAKNKLVLADVTLGIGIAALGAGALWWLLEPGSSTTATTTSARVRVGVRGTTVVAQGAF
jgi:hypothetical protein